MCSNMFAMLYLMPNLDQMYIYSGQYWYLQVLHVHCTCKCLGDKGLYYYSYSTQQSYYTDTFNYKSLEVIIKWYTVAPVHFNVYLLFLQFSKQTVIDCYLSFVENYKTSGKVIENALTTKSSVQKFIEVSFCKRSIIFSRMTKWELIGEC